MKFKIEKLVKQRVPSGKREAKPKHTIMGRVHYILIDKGLVGASLGYMMKVLDLKEFQVRNAIKQLRQNGIQVTCKNGMYRL